MPVKKTVKKRVQKPRVMIIQSGDGLFDFIGNLVKGAQKHKTISNVASGLSKSGIPVLSDIAGVVGPIAGALGFGKPKRKPRKKGTGLNPSGAGKKKTCKKKKAGGSLSLAGRRRR